jgi:hypothetical protein
MNVDQKTVILAALVDFLVEQHYVTADDITEDLLDQLILQKQGRWQFQKSNSSSSASSASARNSDSSSLLTEQQHQHPSAFRFTTKSSSSGVCTIFETSHFSLGWTWESDACFAVQLHLGSGSGSGSGSSSAAPGGFCRVVHSIEANPTAMPSTSRGFSDHHNDDDNVEESLPLWVRDALQIQVILDPVECVVTTESSNSSNSNKHCNNNSSIPNHPSIASVWRSVLGLDFLPKKQAKANNTDLPFTTFQVQCSSVTFVNPVGTCLGRAVNLERSGTSFANVGELQWGGATSDSNNNSDGNNNDCNEHDNTKSRFVATGLQLAFTFDDVFVHIHTIQQNSLFLNAWNNVTPLMGVQVHWDGVQQLKIQIPSGSEWVIVQQQQQQPAGIGAHTAQQVSESDAASGNCEGKSPVNTAAHAATTTPNARSSNLLELIAKPMLTPAMVMWAPVVKVVTEQAVLRIGDDYPVTIKGIEMSFCEETSDAGNSESGSSRSKDSGPGDSIRMMMKASNITLKSCFDVLVLEVTGILQAGAVHALSVHVGETNSVGNSKVQKLWTVLSQALPFHWISGIYAPYATTSAFKSVYAMKKIVNRVMLPGKGHEELPAFVGDEETTIGTILVHYAETFARDIEMRENRMTRAREAVSDSVATTVVRAAVFGASVASPIGMVASVAAVGIKDGVSKAANMGKESRGVAEDDRYKFGDVSRGFAASIRKSTTEGKKNRGASDEDKYSFGDFSRGVSSSFRSNSHHYSSEYNDADGDMDDDVFQGGRSESYMAKNKARYGAVAGSSVGAMVGLAVGGPIGLIAGSLAGGAATQSYLSKKQEAKAQGKKGLIDLREQEEDGEQYDQSVESGQGFAAVGRPKATVTAATATASSESLPSQEGQARSFRLGDNKEETDCKKGRIDLQAEEENGNPYEQNAEEKLSSPEGGGQPYRLGDNLRGLVSRGQKAAGREEGSPYKFGDFSRGLFSIKR